MIRIDRRYLIASVGAVFLGSGAKAKALAEGVPPAPVARKGNVKGVYFGETVSDPYRWMEDPHDPDWLPYLKAQNAHARAVFDAIPGRDRLAGRVQQLSWRVRGEQTNVPLRSRTRLDVCSSWPSVGRRSRSTLIVARVSVRRKGPREHHPCPCPSGSSARGSSAR